jgi:hypothetical protein
MLRSRKAPAGSFGHLLEVRRKQVEELRPGLRDDEFQAAVGYVNTNLAYYSLDQIIGLVGAIQEARGRLSYLSPPEFTELRKMVQVSGDPACLADELVRGIEALRPPPPPVGRPGRPKLTEADRAERIRVVVEKLEAAGNDCPTVDEVAYELHMRPRSLYRWLHDSPDLRRLFR